MGNDNYSGEEENEVGIEENLPHIPASKLHCVANPAGTCILLHTII